VSAKLAEALSGSNQAQEPLGGRELWKEFLFGAKLTRVHASAAAAQLYRMLQVKHFVEDDVLDHVARDARVVEDPADDDGVVGGVVVAEAVAGVVSAPGELRATHESVEEAAVEVFENLVKMVVMTAGGVDLLASTKLAHEAGFSRDIVAGDVAAVAGGLTAVDWLAVELGEQNVRDRMKHRVGRALE